MLPATSVAVQAAVLLPTVAGLVAAQLCEAMLESASVAFGEAVAVPPNNTGFGETVGARVGAVLSILMPLCVFDAVLPALSVQVPIELKAAPSTVKVWLTVGLTAPDVASLQLQLAVTFVLFQPAPFAAGGA